MKIIVVGAGILGASAAYHLARDGAEVVIVDQAHDGRATAAGAGIVCPWASGVEDPVFYQLYADSGRYYADLVPALSVLGETDLGFRRPGALIVSRDTTELAAIETILRRRAAAAPEAGSITRLSPAETQALFPPLHRDFASVSVGGGARVDGRRLSAALLRAALHHGARMHHGQAVLQANGDRVTGVLVNNTRIDADTTVVAAGAWAPALLAPLLAPLGLALSVEPQRGQILHLHLPTQDTRDWPVILPPGSHYLLAFDDSRVVAGATRESGVGFDNRVTAAGQAELLEQALSVAPGLGMATIIETRVGFRPMGQEVRPLLGPVSAMRGLFIGNGLGAAGLTIGPYAGRLLADAALGRTPPLDLTPFDPCRSQGTSRMPPAALR